VQTGWTDDTDHALLIVLSYLHHGYLDATDFAWRLQFCVEQRMRCLDRLPLGLGMTVGRVSSPQSSSLLTNHAGGMQSVYLINVAPTDQCACGQAREMAEHFLF
jgi:ADP-ribosylglycohydrolase